MAQNWFEQNAPKSAPVAPKDNWFSRNATVSLSRELPYFPPPSVEIDLSAPLPDIDTGSARQLRKDQPLELKPNVFDRIEKRVGEAVAPAVRAVNPLSDAVFDATQALATKENAALVAAGVLFPPAAVAGGLLILPKMLDSGADVYGLEEEARRQAAEAKTEKERQHFEDRAKYWKTMRYVIATGIGAGAFSIGKYTGSKVDAFTQRRAVNQSTPRSFEMPRKYAPPEESPAGPFSRRPAAQIPETTGWFADNAPVPRGTTPKATESPVAAPPSPSAIEPVAPAPVRAATPIVAAPVPTVSDVSGVQDDLQLKDLYDAHTALKSHPARGDTAEHIPDYDGHIRRLAAEAEKAPLDVQVDYLDRLEDAAQYRPDMQADITAAREALLLNNDYAGYARSTEAARAKLSNEYAERTTLDQARKLGIEEEYLAKRPGLAARLRAKREESPAAPEQAAPPEEQSEVPVADDPAPAPWTPAEAHMIREGAAIEMNNWAEAVRFAQEQQKRGESSSTVESNVYGKEIEENQNARASGIKSLGAKEGSPLAKFKESPGELAAAIEKKSGKLFESIREAFEPAYADAFLPQIRQYLELASHQEYRAADPELFPSATETSEAIEPPADVGDISFDFSGETGAVRIGLLARPIHHVRQAIFEAAETYGEAGLRKAGEAIGAVFEKITPEIIAKEFRPRPESYVQARRDLRGETAEIKERVEQVGRDLVKSIPDEPSRVLAAKVAQGTATPAEVAQAMQNPAIMAAAQFVKDEFMRLGEQIILAGVRQYGKVAPADRQAIVDVIKGLQQLSSLAPELQPLAKTGIGKYFGEYLPRIYRSREAMNVLKRYGISKDRIRQEFSRLQHRDEKLSDQVRQAMLEITEIVEPAVKGIFQEEMLLAKNRFFERIASDPELTFQPPKQLPTTATKQQIQQYNQLLAQAYAPSNWRKLPDSDLLGPLAGRVVHPSVYRDMMDYVNAPSEAVKVMRTLNRLLKKSKTVYNPATQVRNYQSNWISRDAIGGMDFTSQAYRDVQAFREIVKKGAAYKEARKAGLFDTDYATLDLTDVQIQHVLVPSHKGMSSPVEVAARIFEALSAVDNAATWAYRMGDDVPKMGMYLWLRQEKGMSPKEAVARTLDVLPDYSEVLPIVEKLRRNILGPTFVSYASIQPPRFARSVLKHPIRAGKWVYLGALMGMLLVKSGIRTEDDLEEERKELPGYMQPRAGGAVHRFLPLPFQDSKRRNLYMDLTYTLPFGDFTETSGLYGMPGVFDMGIFPRAVLDAGRNQDSFASYIAGQPVAIYADEDSNSTKASKTGFYLASQLLPTLTPKVGFGARRLESSYKKTPSYFGQAPQDLNLALLQVLAGQKTVAIDKRFEAERRMMTVMGKIGDIDRRIASTRRNQSLSEEERLKEIKRLQESKRAVIQAYGAR